MTLTKFMSRLASSAVCACAAQLAVADLSSELADLAARIDYGFYVDDARAIEAAQPALGRMSDDDSDVRYYRAFAAFRRVQLGAQHAVPTDKLVADCIASATPEPSVERLPRAEAEARAKASAEAWILVAACAGFAGRSNLAKGLERDRRGEQALAKARELDGGNPRVALLDAWLVSRRPALAEPAVRDAAVEKLQAAIEAFAGWSPRRDAPEWGEAEALAALGEVYLARGEVRGARDLIERALLLAPDYRFAVELRATIAGGRAAR
jgi:tetratricopeptide (TPR) repeat protein